MTQPDGLTQAFQTALGMLITNDAAIDGVMAGKLEIERIHPALTAPDVQALRALLQKDGWRVQAIAGLATRRRKARILNLLPASTRILGRAVHRHWSSYLAAEATCGARPSCDDAAAFATRVLATPHDGAATPFLRFELSCNGIAGELESNGAEHQPARNVAFQRVRLSRLVRIERFEFPIDEAMQEFRTRGTLRTDWPREPIHLVFHVLRVRPRMVIATRLSAPLAEALCSAGTAGIDVHELSCAAPPELKAGIQHMIAQLVTRRVLDGIGEVT